MSHDVQTDEQHVSLRTASLVALGALVVFGIGIVWVWWMTVARIGGLRNPTGAIPPALGATEINIVNQRMFEFDDRAEWFRVVKTERLTTYGWSSREAERVHIPVEEAIGIWIERQRGDDEREHDHEHQPGMEEKR